MSKSAKIVITKRGKFLLKEEKGEKVECYGEITAYKGIRYQYENIRTFLTSRVEIQEVEMTTDLLEELWQQREADPKTQQRREQVRDADRRFAKWLHAQVTPSGGNPFHGLF